MKKKYIAIAVLLLLMPLLAGAQALKGSYFMDNSTNRHRMNPAFAPRSNYLQLPVISNLGLGAGTNLDVPSFLYPKNGELLTFLHKDVSVAEFQKTFPQYPHLDVDLNTNILSFGFYTKRKSFWTFEIDTRVMLDADLPSDLFPFLKKGTGTTGESFNIGNVNIYATGAVQAALGYSRNIVKGLRVGAKARVIAPLAYAGVNLEKVTLTTAQDKWNIATEGHAYVASQFVDVSLPEPNSVPSIGFNMPDMNNLSPNSLLAGLGYSFDLGVEYRFETKGFFNGFRVSAAITDLGQIHYNKDVVSAFQSNGSVDWVGFQNVSLNNMDFEASLNDFMDNAKGLLNLTEDEEAVKKSFTRSTMPRVYAGLEIPFMWKRMSVGVLYSARKSHSYLRQELTASLNLKPLKWLSLGANYSFLNTKGTVGGVLEITPKAGMALYLGCDYFPLAVANAPLLESFMGEAPSLLNSMGFESWIVPMSMRLNLNFGIAFTLGAKNSIYR